MINPAQYTQVLQQASDPQLMQMLKRPDKIPSQFVVAEINRRQSMRQAAMAERQRQAGVQEMMTAQQAMPQQQAMMPQQQAPQPRPAQMREGGMVSNAQKLSELSSQLSNLVGGEGQSSGNITNLLSNNGGGGLYNLSQPAYRPVQRPVAFPAQLFGGFDQGFNRLAGARGMSRGGAAKAGPNLLTALGMNTNAPGPERYGIPPFDPNRETVSEYNFRVNKARRDKMAMERMAIADAAMRTDADIQRPDDTAAGLRDAEMFMSTTGRSGDVEDLGSQASGVPSEASRRDGGVKDPFFKFGGVNFGNVFSDGSPADILKALQGTGATVSGPDERGLRADRKKRPPGEDTKGPFDTATSGGRNDPPRKDRVLEPNNEIIGARGDRSRRLSGEQTVEDQVLAQRAADEAALANREASFPSPAIVTPENPNSVKKGGGITAFTEGDAGENLPVKGADDGKKKPSDTALSVVNTALEAMESDIAAISGGIKGDDANANTNTSNRPAIPTPVTVGSDKASVAATSPNANKTGGDSATEGGIKNAGGPDAKAGGGNENPFAITSETKTFSQLAREANTERDSINNTIQGLMTNANEDQAKALETYKTDMDALLTAQKNFMEVFEKNSMTPENRIFRSMIDAGLALAGSKESNFLNAVGQAGKVGIETFDRLNAEQKQNLFDKYSAAVDFQRAKVDVNTKINSMANSITQGQIGIAESQRDAIGVNQAAIREAAALDLDAGLKIDAAGRDQQRVQLDEDQLKLARDRFGFEKETGKFNMGIKERAQTVNEMLANSELFKTVATVEQGDAKIGILSEQLGIDRDKLDWQKASTAIDQQLKAIGLDKPADSVAKLEWMKGEFGEDGLKEILLGREKAQTGAVTEDDILAAATKMYQADPNAIIPGVKEADPQAAIDYYAKSIRSAFGQSGGGGQSAPADPLGLN